MATDISELDNNADVVPSQTVVTSSIVVPSTSTAKRSSRSDALPKRRASSDFSRHNTEEAKRPRLDMTNNEVKKRSQRLFGVLLGTLTKFKNESQNKTEAEIKREQIDQKLQEKLKKDHEELVEKMKREEQERKEKVAREKREAEEKRINDLKECWKNQKRNLANFLCTTTEPPLYYLPARLSQPMLETIAVQKRHLALTLSSSIHQDENSTNEDDNNAEEDEIEMVEKSNEEEDQRVKEDIEENLEDNKTEQPDVKIEEPSEKVEDQGENIAVDKLESTAEVVPTSAEEDYTDANDTVHEDIPTKDVVNTVDSKDDPVEY
ncbi:pinin/SDK/memA/ protein conserved region-domain-containing protein [Glomus cerebriforme]|uniref:Pinin/SDK/memA/ protein conserved region-domain-containing protein n=1 Tax=Glomus cerebriforme TaxID=658196 RepID=A0A397TBQ1_9GLOM|nr:pinin/SDK/memA/ protein conserved region-domain-containing protein [Glomus cerebriforme]